MKKLTKLAIVSGLIAGVAALLFSKAQYVCFMLWKQNDSCPILVSEGFGVASDVLTVFAHLILSTPTNSVPLALLALGVNFALWGILIGSLVLLTGWVPGERNGDA